MKPLSVAIITLNEEKNIERCLASVATLADEIIVIDSFSTDATEAICKKYGASFETHIFEGYIEQKQFALSRCTSDFILSIDADEALSETLIASIKHEKEKGFPSEIYSMSRLTNYCGQWIKHCGWYPDIKLRLFNKQKGQWGGQNPHDKFIFNDRTLVPEHLSGDILHYSYYAVEEHYRQANNFASIAAKSLFEKGKRSSKPYAAMKSTVKFLRNYIFKVGFLDGRKGFLICKITALETWWKYTRLISLTKKQKNDL